MFRSKMPLLIIHIFGIGYWQRWVALSQWKLNNIYTSFFHVTEFFGSWIWHVPCNLHISAEGDDGQILSRSLGEQWAEHFDTDCSLYICLHLSLRTSSTAWRWCCPPSSSTCSTAASHTSSPRRESVIEIQTKISQSRIKWCRRTWVLMLPPKRGGDRSTV